MRKGYIYAGTTVCIWSTMAAVVKKALFDIPNLEALSVSSFFAFAFLLVLNIKTGKIADMKRYTVRDYAVMAGLGFVGLFLYSALYYYGLSVLTSQEACILNYLWPMMLVLFSCLILKERMTVMKAFAMLCSFAGIVILSAGGQENANASGLPGMVACVVAAACYGLFSVLNKKADFDQNISMMIIWLTTAVCALALGVMTEDWVAIKGTQWLGMAWLGVVVDAVGYLLWAVALKQSKNTARIANLAYLTPFLSLLVSAVLLKEPIQAHAVTALVFIVGGILLQSLFDHRQLRSADPSVS